MPEPVCLIIPPSPFLLDERVFMSLGILRVAAVLERAGHAVDVLDLSGVQNYLEVVKAYAQKSKVSAFGITATTPQMPSAAKIAHVLKDLLPDVRRILGGPHPTLVWAALKKNNSPRAVSAAGDLSSLFDVIVAGDGEQAIFQALAPYVGTTWKNQWIDADDPRTPLFLTNADLNQLPYPARHLVDAPSYHYKVDGVPAMSLIAQLGCPFQCGFCGGRNSSMLRRVRTRTTENVVGEIEHLFNTYGVKGFMLYDDELNVNPQMIPLMRAIAKLQKEKDCEFRLRGFIKSQLFTDDQAEAMFEAGFRWILTGFESGSPRILENINKRATREENTRCVEIARRHKLKVKALMSIGHPGESVGTLADTRDWLLENKPDDFDVTIITPYPGSPYYDDAVKENDYWIYKASTGDRLWAREVNYMETADYYKGNPDGGYQSYVRTDDLTENQLITGRDLIEKEVRAKLNIPFNPGAPGIYFEHSMGMSIPPSILKCSTWNLTNKENLLV